MTNGRRCAIEKALELGRRLAADRPAKFNLDLAISLSGLSGHLSTLGCREEALHIIEEAVGVRRRLAADRPTVFIPDLATSSLNNLSLRLAALDRADEALHAIDEAVKLLRRLAVAFNPHLAIFLGSFFPSWVGEMRLCKSRGLLHGADDLTSTASLLLGLYMPPFPSRYCFSLGLDMITTSFPSSAGNILNVIRIILLSSSSI